MELTIEKVINDYEKSKLEPIPILDISDKGTCGCLVGAVYAADKGYVAPLNNDQQNDLFWNAEKYIYNEYGFLYEAIAYGFDDGFVGKKVSTYTYLNMEDESKWRDDYNFGYEIGQKIAERFKY